MWSINFYWNSNYRTVTQCRRCRCRQRYGQSNSCCSGCCQRKRAAVTFMKLSLCRCFKIFSPFLPLFPQFDRVFSSFCSSALGAFCSFPCSRGWSMLLMRDELSPSQFPKWFSIQSFFSSSLSLSFSFVLLLLLAFHSFFRNSPIRLRSCLYFSFSILTHGHLANYNLNRKRHQLVK